MCVADSGQIAELNQIKTDGDLLLDQLQSEDGEVVFEDVCLEGKWGRIFCRWEHVL